MAAILYRSYGYNVIFFNMLPFTLLESQKKYHSRKKVCDWFIEIFLPITIILKKVVTFERT